MNASSPPGPVRFPRWAARPLFRVRSMADLLSLAPVVLGFEPHESLVVAAVAGSRPGFHARVDLPDATATDHAAALGSQLAEVLSAQGCTRVAVLGFTSNVAMEASLRQVAAVVDGAGVEVVDVVRSDGARYWSLTCADTRCCPAEGTGYDPRSSPVRAEAALAGISVAPDRDAVAARFAACSGASAARMRTATDTAEREVVAVLGLRGAPSARPLRHAPETATAAGAAELDRVLDRLLDRLSDESASHSDALDDADAATLSVWCSVVCFRDLAWARIDRAHASRHLALWSAVARKVVPPYEPAVLSLAAFAAWAAGDGASAWCAVDRALAAEPGYPMARLIGEALTRCVPPDLWTPPPREALLSSAAPCGPVH